MNHVNRSCREQFWLSLLGACKRTRTQGMYMKIRVLTLLGKTQRIPGQRDMVQLASLLSTLCGGLIRVNFHVTKRRYRD